eukprot:CAMPEP_0181445192 /NCGR_PEP_ID=MMETSP1110-20121109/25460_1 /TAXON_ID=174948 /ORGANISM="Symbiodinium sp., Strain CCMP421" /LENGTH=245 /DNA_ID=CAMNT_0023569227 /DNA_START=140 /DNA_END=873 /DNA_ORIENTATION=+
MARHTDLPPLLFGLDTATRFARFMAYSVCSGYHCDMVSTNLAFLLWLSSLVVPRFWDLGPNYVPLLALGAFANFFAAATTRFNDSGMSSGLSFFLPPFFMVSPLVLLLGGIPTMLWAGAVCGHAAAGLPLLGAALLSCFVVLQGVFFLDCWVWVPQTGYLGGAGSSEDFGSSYPRAGFLPATFAASFLVSLAAVWGLNATELQALALAVLVVGLCLLRLFCGPLALTRLTQRIPSFSWPSLTRAR